MTRNEQKRGADVQLGEKKKQKMAINDFFNPRIEAVTRGIAESESDDDLAASENHKIRNEKAKFDLLYLNRTEEPDITDPGRRFPETLSLLASEMTISSQGEQSQETRKLFVDTSEKLFPEEKMLGNFKPLESMSKRVSKDFPKTSEVLKQYGNDETHARLVQDGPSVIEEVQTKIMEAFEQDQDEETMLSAGKFNLDEKGRSAAMEIMRLVYRLELLKKEAILRQQNEASKKRVEELGRVNEEQDEIDDDKIEEVIDGIEGIDDAVVYDDYAQLASGRKFRGTGKMYPGKRELEYGTGEVVWGDTVEKGDFKENVLHGDDCEVLVDGKMYQKGRFEHGVLLNGEVHDMEIKGKKYTGGVKMSDKEGLLPHGEGVWKTGLFRSQRGRFEDGVLIEKR